MTRLLNQPMFLLLNCFKQFLAQDKEFSKPEEPRLRRFSAQPCAFHTTSKSTGLFIGFSILTRNPQLQYPMKLSNRT